MRKATIMLKLGRLLLAGGLVLDAGAQTPAVPADSTALRSLRDDLFNRVLSGSRQLSVQFATALVKLEDSLAANGDYEDALTARKRRLALGAIYSVDSGTATTTARPTDEVISTASAVSLSDVESLKQVFLRNLHAAKEPVLTAHAAEIETLLAQPASMANAEYHADIKAEQGRLSRMREGMKRPGAWRLEGLSTSGLEGFEDIASAVFVNDPGNTGDRFRVEHSGGAHFIQLLWVRCPPAVADGVALAAAAKFFGTAPEDALAVGRLSAEFTRGYLSGKPLRLMLRPAAAKDGVIPALVFIGEGGLYQSMLLDHGFAALVAPGAGAKRSVAEFALVKSLADREKAAREARPPVGIWALKDIQGGNSK
jgi:hypothetical protein